MGRPERAADVVTDIRVLHVNDAAFTTANILREAKRRELPWSYLPIAVTETDWHGVSGKLRRAARGLRWEARLARRAAAADLLHIHVASVVRHTAWLPRPYVLHLHGTDIRTHQYDPRYAALVRRAVERAAAVLYSTPDLAEHVRWRPDAALLPVPVDVAALPAWRPDARPTVVFASRWEAVKGLPVQVAIADSIRRHEPEVRLVGLDWGSGAADARTHGVRLVPRLRHAEFLDLLATAHVVVGQPTGMLAASELEALGMGVPVVAPLEPRWYLPVTVAVPPVLGGLAVGRAHRLPAQDPDHADAPTLASDDVAALAEALAREALTALEDPRAASLRLDGPAWLAREHGPGRAVDQLVALYASLR